MASSRDAAQETSTMAKDPALPAINEIIVGGRRVTFKTRFPVRENRQLGMLIDRASSEDTMAEIALLRAVILSWELDGDPTTASAYEDLDALLEIKPMIRGFVSYIQARRDAADDPKN